MRKILSNVITQAILMNRLPFLPTSCAVKNSHPNATIIVVINRGSNNVPTIAPRNSLGVLVMYGGATITTNTILTICLQNTIDVRLIVADPFR